MLIGKAPNQVDTAKVSTPRLLAYKKKNYSHPKCFHDAERYGDVHCEQCSTKFHNTFKSCKQYEVERNAIIAELNTREHIEK